MKKNSSMQGTLNKLFGKKSASNTSLYANNPPWILVQGTKKASVDYTEEVHNSFAFLDDSGTATLKSRPGPRVRPVLQLSTSNTDTQGLAVPTPSVPAGFTDNASTGNGSKLNGSYRLYSSVGDLRFTNYDDDDDYVDADDDLDEIPAPPSMPPPPPPTMAPPPPPPPPPQKSPPSSVISSPQSPSPPDFIPPTPNSSVPVPPSFLPTDQSAVQRVEQHQTNNVTKCKSETVLNAFSKDLPMTLPNRFSMNPAAFQHNQGQTNFSAEPQSTLPRSFKIPPPAPARTSSIQLPQEPQNIDYSKDPPQNPVRSSFNPSFQAKLFTAKQQQQSLNDTLNKRKSMLIMEDLPDFSEKSDQGLEKTANMTDSLNPRVPQLKENTSVLQNLHVALNKGTKNEDINHNKMEPLSISKEDLPLQSYRRLNSNEGGFTSVVSKQGEGQKYSQNGADHNTLNKRGHTQEIHKTLKPAVKCISIKPIINELSLSNANGSKHNSLTAKEMEVLPQELTRINKEVYPKPEKSSENVNECPPTPPLKASLSLPVQNITPPKTPPKTPPISSTTPPLAPPFRLPSPLLSPKPKTISVTPKQPALVPPPPPPKAPPAPPPLPSSYGPSSSVPLLEALQAKQQTLRKIPKSIEVRPAQTTPMPSVDNEQKIRVGKIKGELEALFSPKKDEKRERLINSRMEANKNSNGNFSQSGGENKLVNSLMLKVPLLPAKLEKDDVDADNSEWLPKSNNLDIQIPEPDYLPASPAYKLEKPIYAKLQNKIPKATLDIPVAPLPVASPQKDTSTEGVFETSIPTYKPHRETKLLTESISLDELPVQISQPVTNFSINLDSVSQHTEIANVEQEAPLKSPAESTINHPVTGDQVEANSPLALLMAAQKRAQKAKSLERGNLPKISVTSGIIKSISASPYNERRANTFVVSPYKGNTGNSTEEVTSFASNSIENSDSVSNSSTQKDGVLQSYDITSTLDRDADNSNDKFSVPYVYNSVDIPVSTTNRNEDYLKPKSTTFDNRFSTTVPSSTESPSFNISSFPSPIPDRKMDTKIEYEIIPPPAEFMNSPVQSISSSMQQENRSHVFDHDTSLHSDLSPTYDRINSVIQPFPSLSNTSNFGYYSSDNYGTAQRSSLIKKRLYMPEPESSWNYGKNTSSLRSSTMPGSYINAKSSSNMVLDPRRSNTTSRFLPQGRRDYSENMNRIVPPMTDLKYKSQSSDYSMGQSSSRAQSKLPQGMTFTVRPGTRQPISQMYQGGYL
ncbi:uncharacterized protein C6orf132 homolog [Hyla sarda]|uniref:uncharacterized protein C6orf132 homolog n=1 Tax=Hyla sarda TaxID=327740 RepID=UPI0024C290D1|nr:uncharacterized protein C6orf132 homolog [Hyla sarda]